jgi:hypothetical protein
MKILLLVALLLSTFHAQELTPSQVSKIRNYRHSLSGKLRYQQRLKHIATIKSDKVEQLTKEACHGESMEHSKLKYHNARLFYVVYTASCYVKIDALDGSIMEKK